MRAPGEGDVADAVMGGMSKTGGGGEQESLMENIDAETEAHKQALHEGGRGRGLRFMRRRMRTGRGRRTAWT
jgi:hypothetical protein